MCLISLFDLCVGSFASQLYIGNMTLTCVAFYPQRLVILVTIVYIKGCILIQFVVFYAHYQIHFFKNVINVNINNTFFFLARNH